MNAVRVLDRTRELEQVRETLGEYLKYMRSPPVNMSYEDRLREKARWFKRLNEVYDRSGSTLMEVLIALLLMSVGVVTVASLFVLATLRTARATQLTSATNLRYTAEAMIEVYPSILIDPDVDQNQAEHLNERYVVDPLGWVQASGASQNLYGNLQRYNLGRVTEELADKLVTSPDSWRDVRDDTLTSVTTLQADLVGLAASGFVAAPGQTYRMTLWDQRQNRFQFRTVTAFSGDTVQWNNRLPPAFSPDRGILTYLERLYTFLYTVRHTLPTGGDVDVVVFYRRSFDAVDEQVYPATFQIGSSVVQAIYGGSDQPIRAGGYILDSDNAHWYRVAKASYSNSGVQLLLETPAVQNSPPTGGHLMAPRGIVDVYPLGPKTYSFP